MSLEVIGAGFGRTGTLSMKAALEQLGYKRTHHMQEVAKSGKQVALWNDIARGGQPDWDEVFSGFKASTDFPSSLYYRELAEHFPAAKVVLITRDVDGWYVSAEKTIYQITQLMPAWILRLVPRIRALHEMIVSIIWDGVFEGNFEDEARAKRIFRDYEAAVKEHIPPDRLLVFSVKEGWEPLCDFLGCEVPEKPFPHLNDAKSYKFRLRALKALGGKAG